VIGGRDLEQRYRRVLRLLPGYYRQLWEEDMVAAFLDSWLTGDPDEDECVLEFCRPGWQEVASVAGLAVRLYLGAAGAPRRYFTWGQAVRRAVLAVMLVHAVLGLDVLVRTAWSRRLFGLPAPPVPGQPVIAAQPAVVRLLPVGLDQPLGGEPVQHPVQAADLQLHPALRQPGHLAHDAVPVPRATGQRGEHEERLARHGLYSHPANILKTKILVHSKHWILAAPTPNEQAAQNWMFLSIADDPRQPPSPGAESAISAVVSAGVTVSGEYSRSRQPGWPVWYSGPGDGGTGS